MQYSCPHCGKQLTADAEQAGTRIECQHCGQRIKVPAGATTNSEPSQQGEEPSVGVTRQIGFACPICDSRIHAHASQSGETIVCPDCLEAVPVPQLPKESKTTESPSDKNESVHADSSDEVDDGLQLEPPVARSSAANVLDSENDDPADDDDEFRLEPPIPLPELEGELAERVNRSEGVVIPPDREPEKTTQSEAPKKSVGVFGMHCEICETRWHVTEAEIGTTVACPDCGVKVLVTAPSKEKPVQRVSIEDLEGGDFKISDPEPLPVHQKISDDAERIAEAEVKEEPQPYHSAENQIPQNPLVTGVFRCFLDGRTWLVLLILVLIHAFNLFMWGMVFDQTSKLLAALLGVVSIPVFVATVIVTGVQGVAVLQESAEGRDGIRELPPFDLLEWFGEGSFVLLAAVYSIAPAIVLSVLGCAGMPYQVLLVFGLISGIMLFPFVLLLMQENASFSEPVSQPIFQSLRKHPRRWTIFYVESTVVVGVAAAVLAISWVSFGPDEAPGLPPAVKALAAIVIAPLIVLYFRLLGRLTWWLTEPESETSDDDDKDKDQNGAN